MVSFSKVTVIHCMVICALCFVFYGNTIPNGYAYDDSVVITENRFTQKGISGIPAIFGNNTFLGSYGNAPIIERYRPLSLATFAVEIELVGKNPHVSHFVNIVLLIATVTLLYWLLLKVFEGREPGNGFFCFPFIAALLFIAHPVHVETVANIKGRDELLALAGSLCATLSILGYIDTRKYRYLALGFFLFLAALFSKETAVTFLAVIPLTIYYYKKGKWPAYFYSLMPIMAAGAVFLCMRAMALRGYAHLLSEDIISEPFAFATLPQRYATAVYTVGRYLGLLMFPHPLTTDYYPYQLHLTNWKDPAVWLSLSLCVSAIAFALWNCRRRSVIAYGILFFTCTFSIVSNLPFSIGSFMGERFMFMPSLGFIIIIAWLLSKKPALPSKLSVPITVILLILCFFKTYARNEAWKDDFTLFTTDAETSGNSIKANIAASVSFLMELPKTSDAQLAKKYRESALKYSRKGVSIYEKYISADRLKAMPSYNNAILLLGDCYGENGMLDSALRCYGKIINSVPNRAHLFDAIDATISKSGDIDFEIKRYSEFVKLAPGNFTFNFRLGFLYGKEKNDIAKAVYYLQNAVDIRPDQIDALVALSYAYELSKDYQKALFYLERVAAMNPDEGAYEKKLLHLYTLTGNRAKEIELTKRIGDLK